jgi:hypothetical protein
MNHVLKNSSCINITQNTIQQIPLEQTPKYIAECKTFEEYRKNNAPLTGLASLIAPGPRDWLKRGETWDDLCKEIQNHYYN